MILKYLQPLEQLQSEFEEMTKSDVKETRDFARHGITLLTVFTTEPAMCYFVARKMTRCQKHGLVAQYRCKNCPEYDAWFTSLDDNSNNCIYREDFLL